MGWQIEKGQRVQLISDTSRAGTIVDIDPATFIICVRWDPGTCFNIFGINIHYDCEKLRYVSPLEELAYCSE